MTYEIIIATQLNERATPWYHEIYYFELEIINGCAFDPTDTGFIERLLGGTNDISALKEDEYFGLLSEMDIYRKDPTMTNCPSPYSFELELVSFTSQDGEDEEYKSLVLDSYSICDSEVELASDSDELCEDYKSFPLLPLSDEAISESLIL